MEIKNEDGTRDLICDKDSIKREIGRANKEKLLQANNAPLQMEPLFSHFGETGENLLGPTGPSRWIGSRRRNLTLVSEDTIDAI